MKIRIYGPGCSKCLALAHNVKEAADRSGGDFDIEKVEDLNAIIDAGIFQTPGLEIDGEIITQGEVPKVDRLVTILSSRTE